MTTAMADMLAFIGILEGVDFDTFFRGLGSVVILFLILVGGTYLIIATNTGFRGGFLIAAAGLFGWMFLMGIFWTVYAKGWIGEASTWHLEEQITSENRTLELAGNEEVASLAAISFQSAETDPDAAQDDVLSQSLTTNLNGWEYLVASNSTRGDAQSAAITFLTEEGSYFPDGTGFVPLQFGAFTIGGKPKAPAEPNKVEQVGHFFEETFLNPTHPEKLVVIQFQGSLAQINPTGEAPAITQADPNKPIYTVIMSRDRGGPVPNLISGLRFTPFAFTLANGLIFLILVGVLHMRDLRYEKNESS